MNNDQVALHVNKSVSHVNQSINQLINQNTNQPMNQKIKLLKCEFRGLIKLKA